MPIFSYIELQNAKRQYRMLNKNMYNKSDSSIPLTIKHKVRKTHHPIKKAPEFSEANIFYFDLRSI